MSVIVSNIHEGDVLLVDKGGRRFYARATETPTNGTIKIKPIERWASWYTASSREVVGHWIATTATRRAGL